MATLTTTGILIEGIGGWLHSRNFFLQLSHEVLYFGFFAVALTAIYESKGKLPPDTVRVAAVLAFLGSYLMWYSHGQMKELMVDKELHILLAYINLANAAIMAYSIRFNDSTVAYVAGYALIMIQAIWLLLAGLYECRIELNMHDIAAYLSGLMVLMFVVIVSVYAQCVVEPVDEMTEQYDSDFRQSFAPLKTTTLTNNGDALEDEYDEETDYERGVDG